VDLRSLEIKVSRSENLPVLPQIVSQVLSLADDANASNRSMERLIECDAAIAAKILRVASSAFYGAAAVPTIGRAISILGMNTIRALVVGIAYQQVISGRTSAVTFSKLDFWRHCLATATAARILGKMIMPAKGEDLYCAGMLHDVGLLVLDRFSPNDLDAAIKTSLEEQVPLHMAEDHLYGFNHAMIGEILATKWNLAPLVKAAIRYHHDVCDDDEHHISTCIVAASDYLAHRVGYGNPQGAVAFELDDVVKAALNLPEGQLDVILTVLGPEVEKAEQAFGIA
jgi:HD-like signal output (HDOD) protein